jgi:serine/threonine protein kinase
LCYHHKHYPSFSHFPSIVPGTVGYMSPELILTGHCSKATDVFAAGTFQCVLLFCEAYYYYKHKFV